MEACCGAHRGITVAQGGYRLERELGDIEAQAVTLSVNEYAC
jgi:hypothetical protein